jgi:hypothetical protein
MLLWKEKKNKEREDLKSETKVLQNKEKTSSPRRPLMNGESAS